MDTKESLELCLQVSGSFENGDPAYDAITGNFDGCGISVGILQWNAGTGSLCTLIGRIVQLCSAETVNSFFSNGEDVASLAGMSPQQARQYCVTQWLQDGMNLKPSAVQDWQSFLQSDQSIQAQVDLATNGVLARADALVAQYSPATSNQRDVCFFFDIVTQSGSMQNSRGSVQPLADPSMTTHQMAIQMTQLKSARTAQHWSEVCAQDPQARLLLHYAYQRALLSRPEYVWDALSRRGCIACRGGVVHGAWFDFSKLLP